MRLLATALCCIEVRAPWVLPALPGGLRRLQYRLTVDEKEDVELMQRIFEQLQQPGRIVSTREAIKLLDREPELAKLNAHLRHKAHNVRSVELDASIRRRGSVR